MFDFTDMFQTGREITAHGCQWVIVKSIGPRLYLATKPETTMPCQVYLVREDKKDETPA